MPLSVQQRATLSGLPLDLAAVRGYFSSRLNAANLASVMRVATKLVNGDGITHKSKPDECFREGEPVRLDEDLTLLREEAAAWLPTCPPGRARWSTRAGPRDHAQRVRAPGERELRGEKLKSPERFGGCLFSSGRSFFRSGILMVVPPGLVRPAVLVILI